MAGVPDPRRAVAARGDDARAVRAEGGAIDRARVPAQVASGAPLAASQIRAVPSQLAVTTRAPSGLKAAR